MTTTRYFEVKVTGCKNCPRANQMYSACMEYSPKDDALAEIRYYKQNFDQLTSSCPMWDKTKESETK